jgi:hypothetical protein
MSIVNELVEFDKIAAGIADIQEKGNFLPDMTTKDGYEASKRFVLDVTTPTRTKLDKAHKTAKAYWSTGGKNVDSKKNEILEILVDIQKPHQEAYKEFDQIEKQKKAKFEADIQAKVMTIYNYRILPPAANSDVIAGIIQQCGETDTQDGFYHMAKEASIARNESLEILNELLMGAVSHEAEQVRQAELAEENRIRQIQIDEQQEAMRLQQEEMNRKQAEFDRVENEATAKAQHEANEKQRLINEAAQADRLKQEVDIEKERQKQLAESKEKHEKEMKELAIKQEQERQVEIERLDRERIEKEQALRAGRTKNRNTAAKFLCESLGIDKDTAIKIMNLQAEGKVPFVTTDF